MRILPLLLGSLPLLAIGVAGDDNFPPGCELINVPLCNDMLYNYTMLPNYLGHDSQEKIREELEQYAPLVKIQCSRQVQFFICSLFLPMCSTTLQRGVTSCRSVCQETMYPLEVHDACIKTLMDFGFSWPPVLNCSNFPDQTRGEVCMHQPDAGGSKDGGATNLAPYAGDARPPQPHCPPNLVALETRCAPLCGKDLHYAAAHKEFAEGWMGAWASLCALITAFAVLTCLIEPRRFRFPERAIIYIAACYNLAAWAYVARLALGREAASCATLKNGMKFLISGGLENHACVVIFMVLYYFTLASQVWWVVLTLTWFLAARKKWGTEAVEALSSYFHLAAWGLPAVLGILVLVSRRVEASELSGLCGVGESDPVALAAFVVAPRAASLALGILLGIGGFAGLGPVRQELRNASQDADLAKLDRLMTRIAVFTLLYLLPSAVLLACQAYHLWLLWPSRSEPSRQPPPQPNVQLRMLEIFMALIVGTTSGVWVFSRKTFLSWQATLCCLLAPGKKDVSGLQPERTALVYAPPPAEPLRLHSASSYSSAPTHSRKHPHGSYHPVSSAASRL